MHRRIALSILLSLCAAPLAAAPAADKPSHAPEKGCKWEKVTSPTLGFEAWAQQCVFGARKITLYAKDTKLMQHWSDGGEDEALVESFALQPGETAEAAVKRVFAAKTADKTLVAGCVLHPYTPEGEDAAPLPPGVKRYDFLPNAALQKQIDAKRAPDDDGVPDPPCGDWGYTPDGIQYFETQAGAGAVLMVRAGQEDHPLFDEQKLHIGKTEKVKP